MLDQRISRHRRAVPKIAHDGSGACPGIRCHEPQAFLDSLRDTKGWVVGRGRDFPDLNPAALLVEKADVGEGSARIDPDSPGHTRCPPRCLEESSNHRSSATRLSTSRDYAPERGLAGAT